MSIALASMSSASVAPAAGTHLLPWSSLQQEKLTWLVLKEVVPALSVFG